MSMGPKLHFIIKTITKVIILLIMQRYYTSKILYIMLFIIIENTFSDITVSLQVIFTSKTKSTYYRQFTGYFYLKNLINTWAGYNYQCNKCQISYGQDWNVWFFNFWRLNLAVKHAFLGYI